MIHSPDEITTHIPSFFAIAIDFYPKDSGKCSQKNWGDNKIQEKLKLFYSLSSRVGQEGRGLNIWMEEEAARLGKRGGGGGGDETNVFFVCNNQF